MFGGNRSLFAIFISVLSTSGCGEQGPANQSLDATAAVVRCRDTVPVDLCAPMLGCAEGEVACSQSIDMMFSAGPSECYSEEAAKCFGICASKPPAICMEASERCTSPTPWACDLGGTGEITCLGEQDAKCVTPPTTFPGAGGGGEAAEPPGAQCADEVSETFCRPMLGCEEPTPFACSAMIEMMFSPGPNDCYSEEDAKCFNPG